MARKAVTKAISMPSELVERVQEAAKQERRNFSNMVAVLCENQLAILEQRRTPADVVIRAER